MYISPHAPETVRQWLKKRENSPRGSQLLSNSEASSFPLTWTLPGMPENSVDWVLNGFDEHDISNLRLVPLTREEQWETLGALDSPARKAFILGVFPLFTQIGSRFHRAMQSLHTPTCLIPQEKYIVGIAVIMDALDVSTVVLTQAVFEEFDSLARERYPMHNVQYRVVLSPYEAIEKKLQSLCVTYELHLVPGMVGLFQCKKQVRDQQGEFHPSDRLAWEIEETHLRVSDPSSSPRFTHARLPREVRVRRDLCECGRDLHILFI